MIALKDKIVFYLPSNYPSGERIPEGTRFGAFCSWIEPFTKKCGGGTEIHVEGVWYDEKGGMHAEPISLYVIFCNLEEIGGIGECEVVAEGLKHDLRQSAVAFEVGGVLYLV